MPQREKTRSAVRIELTIGLTVLAFCAGIAVGAYLEVDLGERSQRTTDGVISIVNTVRNQMAQNTLPVANSYTDITEVLAQHQLLPPAIMYKGSLQSGWNNPMSVAVNKGSAIPTIEVSLNGMSARACKRFVTQLTRRYYNVSDLRSVWVGPPGRTLSKFPVAADYTGCEGSGIKVILQYQIQASRW